MSEQERTFRIVTRANDGTIRSKDYSSQEPLLELHTQIGVDDCSTNLTLRGLPVFQGLIGPMADENGTVCYESPEVFETLTKEWSTTAPSRTRRRRTQKPVATQNVASA